MVVRLLAASRAAPGRRARTSRSGDARGRRRRADARRRDRPHGRRAVGAHVARDRRAAPDGVRQIRRTELGRGIALVPGVTASSGPIETGFAGVHAGGYHVETRLAEMPPAGPGRPALVEGDAGGLMFERSFARRLGVAPGDTVRSTRRRPTRGAGQRARVVSDQEPYPFGQPGLTFGSRGAARRRRPRRRPALRVRVAAARRPGGRAGGRGASCSRWASASSALRAGSTQRADVGERLESVRIALELLSVLLILCSAPIVATLVSERILARGREFAILRAGGLTPRGIVTLTGVSTACSGSLGGPARARGRDADRPARDRARRGAARPRPASSGRRPRRRSPSSPAPSRSPRPRPRCPRG